jgi:hypothetical protein
MTEFADIALQTFHSGKSLEIVASALAGGIAALGLQQLSSALNRLLDGQSGWNAIRGNTVYIQTESRTVSQIERHFAANPALASLVMEMSDKVYIKLRGLETLVLELNKAEDSYLYLRATEMFGKPKELYKLVAQGTVGMTEDEKERDWRLWEKARERGSWARRGFAGDRHGDAEKMIYDAFLENLSTLVESAAQDGGTTNMSPDCHIAIGWKDKGRKTNILLKPRTADEDARFLALFGLKSLRRDEKGHPMTGNEVLERLLRVRAAIAEAERKTPEFSCLCPMLPPY